MKRIISTEKAPAAIGPYSQATIVNGLLFTSGQIALNPVSGELVMDTIEAETHQVLQNLGALLEAAGASYRDVIKCSVFVKDMHQYARINAVYATYFEEGSAPARELVEVANLPRFVNIEISLIAEIPQ
ncbi:MAG: Rid family detoxifying hydrolase [Saprospiraceae bacterium]|nr:Rid family detoxifying hydrolase [Saprospiraceae bacterium]